MIRTIKMRLELCQVRRNYLLIVSTKQAAVVGVDMNKKTWKWILARSCQPSLTCKFDTIEGTFLTQTMDIDSSRCIIVGEVFINLTPAEPALSHGARAGPELFLVGNCIRTDCNDRYG